jgi:predicted DNA-binding transcriptional regulator AlpA
MKGRLYTTGDLADRLGVGRQRAYVLSRTKDFPEPYEEWSNGLTVWSAADIEEWIKASRYATESDGD